MLRGPPERRMTPVVKSISRKFALLLRGKGERKAHTYDMGCYRQLKSTQ
jgi:hypothetical protein